MIRTRRARFITAAVLLAAAVFTHDTIRFGLGDAVRLFALGAGAVAVVVVLMWWAGRGEPQ